ncbi:MAG: F420-nonreducing hydrogenase, partial [Candidatus Thorarchaeota archaeon]
MDIGIVSLSACSGCQVAILDQKDLLLRIIGDIRFATTVFDQHELPKVDVCLVEGAVRTEEDIIKLKEAREKATHLVALGSCATYGGIQALGNLHTKKQVMEIVAQGEDNPFTETPALHKRVESLDRFVEVDYYIP